MIDFVFERLSAKLVRRAGYHFPVGSYAHAHWCPACEELHDFAVDQPFRNGARWTFDGNAEAPTFVPSMNITVGPFPDGHTAVCHYFLTAGQIIFLGDCTHALAGKTVPLPEIPPRALARADETALKP